MLSRISRYGGTKLGNSGSHLVMFGNKRAWFKFEALIISRLFPSYSFPMQPPASLPVFVLLANFRVYSMWATCIQNPVASVTSSLGQSYHFSFPVMSRQSVDSTSLPLNVRFNPRAGSVKCGKVIACDWSCYNVDHVCPVMRFFTNYYHIRQGRLSSHSNAG
jgi:hypothetical protein